MNAEHISQLILEYRYWILVPLTFLEGPVIAFIAGTMAALGYFNIYGLAALFFVRDVGLDAILYMIGYFGGQRPFAQRMLKKIGIEKPQLLEIRKVWDRYPARTMFIGKLSYGISQAFIIVAGTVRMPFVTFFKYGALVAVTQYGFLLMLGYFFGNSFGGSFTGILQNIQYVIAVVAIIISAYYIFSWYMRRRMLKQHRGK